LQGGVEPVLRQQTVTLVRALEAHADHPPVTQPGGKQIFRVKSLVGTHEGAETKMNNAGTQSAAVIAGPLYSRFRAVQG
jgi:hypothetical protein